MTDATVSAVMKHVPSHEGSSKTARLFVRWLLAGPGAIVFALAALAAMPVWFPRGAAGINHVAFTATLFPAFWAIPVFYVLLEERLGRAAFILLAVTLVNLAIAYSSGGW